MRTRTSVLSWSLVALAALLVVPARASTFLRLGLEELTSGSNIVLVGEVLDIHSYWSPDETFILTDVRIAPTRVLKGAAQGPATVVTVPGGTVGDLTTLIVGGPALEPGRSYVLFLRDASFAGVWNVQTVPAFSQGVFEIVKTATGLRAVSQAADHGVLPGAGGHAVPPGGTAGLPLDEILERVEAITRMPADAGGGRRE